MYTHFECYRLEESFKTVSDLQSFVKEGTENGRILLVEEIEDVSRMYKEEGSPHDTYEERIEDVTEEEYMLIEPDEVLDEKPIEKNPFEEVFELVHDNEVESEQVENDSPQQPLTVASTSSLAKSITDPDERYLMSCLPAFKRFTPQQKAYVRMGIEQLFYEVEFGNVSESRSKKLRLS